MAHLFLLVLAALVAAATSAVTLFVIEEGDELTQAQARVLTSALTAMSHVTVGVSSALLDQDTPFTLIVKAVIPLLR
ncbi:hypothetical protein [Streptomyces sp. NPDC050535]|uniref:hypothetical protein n=1 Tax=Streptomyces sp. NPDC050535 TaxID=3365626 RepID=UPI0037967829